MMDKWNKADYYRKLNEDLINHMIDAELKIAKMQAVVDAAINYVADLDREYYTGPYAGGVGSLGELKQSIKELDAE